MHPAKARLKQQAERSQQVRGSNHGSWCGRALAVTAMVAALAVFPAAASAQPGQPPAATEHADAEGADGDAPAAGVLGTSETGRWIVQLDEPSLATYEGGITGLSATSPEASGAPSLDMDSAAAVAYSDHLQTRHNSFATNAQSELGRNVTIEHNYRAVLNAVVVEADRSEAAQLADMPEVANVYPDELREFATDVSHEVIGTAGLWDGDSTAEGIGTRGEGVLVGVLDSGINPDHPSFAATDESGYQHQNPLGEGQYLGACDPSDNSQPDEAICNDKLIGAWTFDYRSTSAIDMDGHGSHTAATAAGNMHEAEVVVGDSSFTRTVSGVAPRANLISYQVCLSNCPITAILAGIDQAVTDEVDVINFSISGADDPWTDPVSIGFLEAANTGIFVAAAAGNNGPGAGTAAHTGPWITAVAATTTNRVFAQTMDVTATGAPDHLSGMPAVPSDDGPGLTDTIDAPVRDAHHADTGNGTGCAAFPEGTFDGSIALIERGDCEFSVKVGNAAAAGADAVVIFSNAGGPPTTMGGLEGTSVPAVMIGQDDGLDLREHLSGAGEAQARLNPETSALTDEAWADTVAGFSSRGPSQHDLIAPTVAAPGVNILAADAGAPDAYMVQQGTSMASPHVAGAGALLTALHPDWTPMQIRSALAASANPDGLRTDTGEATAFDRGSGRIDLQAAGRTGLILDESYANLKGANPAPGFDGDPRTLNVPALVDDECGSVCTWTRTLTNAADTTTTYTATDTSAEGLSVQVEPASITLAPGESATVEITAGTSALPVGDRAFGSVTWSADAAHPSGAPITDAQFPIVVMSSPAQIEIDPTEVESKQAAEEITEHTVTIGNPGGQDLEWSVVDDADAQAFTLRPVTGTPITAAPLPTARTLPGQGEELEPSRNPVAATNASVARNETPERANGSVTLTHSESQEIVPNNTVACSTDLGFTADNGYLRTFTLSDFAIADDFDVTDVSFGVEAVNHSPATITVRLYTLDGETLTYDNMTQIGNAEVTLQPQVLEMVTVPVTGTAPAGSTLVVELDAPDMSAAGGFFPGSNAQGESAPSYLRSEGCGMPEPAPMSAIGFPDTNLVLNVTGTTEAPGTQLPEWMSIAPMSGTVAAGESQELTVTIDSSGMSEGEHRAIAMLASNDPERPTTPLPVTVTVGEDDEQPPVDSASQDIVATVPQSGGDDGSLLISVDPQDATVELPEMTSRGDRLASTGELRPVRVTDSRVSDPGWDVTAEVSDFAADDDAEPFSGGYLGWTPSVGSTSEGQEVTPGGAVAPGFPDGDGLSVPRLLGSAETGAGRGAATLGAGVELQVPVDTPPGVYTAVLTITAV